MKSQRSTGGIKSRYRRSRGFSLIEVLCAVLILGVGVVGLTQGITTALQSNKESEVQTCAAQIAAGVIETLRAEGTLIDGTTEGTCGPGLDQYQWKQSISAAGIDGLHEVEVVVQHAVSGKSIYELKTLLFEIPSDSPAVGNSREKDSKSRGGRGAP